MKQKLFSILTILALTLSVLTLFSTPSAAAVSTWDGTIADGFAGGDGSEENPYRIATADQLAFLSASVAKGNSYEGKYIVLTSNIQLNEVSIVYNDAFGDAFVHTDEGRFGLETGVEQNKIDEKIYKHRGAWVTYNLTDKMPTPPTLYKWEPIGSMQNPFNGKFNGYGHTVSGVYCNDRERDYVGLFGYSNKGCVQNLQITDSFFCGKNYVGSILGRGTVQTNWDGTETQLITNCYSSAVVSGEQFTGGILGEGEISDCVYEGGVVGKDYTGGIVGNTQFRIEFCRLNGYVYGQTFAGGIAGFCQRYIYYCHTNGTVVGKTHTGGICGRGNGNNSYCFNEADITANNLVGGIAGNISESSRVKYCYNKGSVQGNTSIGGIIGMGTAYSTYNLGTVTGNEAVGGIAGEGGADQCENFGSVNGHGSVGGICGRKSNSSKIKLCRNSGTVQGETDVGGVVGSGSVEQCANMAEVSGTKHVGGIVGKGDANYSYNIGQITGTVSVGGICGYTSDTITQCYNVGNIIGHNYVGGIVGEFLGKNSEYPISNCYYLLTSAIDQNSTLQNAIGSETAGTTVENPTKNVCGMSNDEMMKLASYDGFNFSGYWSFYTDADLSYPSLKEMMHTKHSYHLEISQPSTLAQKATCQSPTSYYYSCSCGFLSFETFEAGSPLEHDVAESIWIYDTSNHWHACCLCAAKTENEAHVWDEEKTEFLVTGNFKYLSLFCSTCSNEIRIDLPYSLQVPDQEPIQTPQLPGIPTTQEVDTTYQTIQTIFFFVMGCVVGGFALYGFYTVKELRRQLQDAKNKQNKQNGRYP